MLSSSNTREHPRIEPQADKGTLSAAGSLGTPLRPSNGTCRATLFAGCAWAWRWPQPASRSFFHRGASSPARTSIPRSHSRFIDGGKWRYGMRCSTAPRNCWARSCSRPITKSWRHTHITLPPSWWRYTSHSNLAGPPLGMLAAAEVFLVVRDRKAPFCAKLHHHNDKRCIFRQSGTGNEETH